MLGIDYVSNYVSKKSIYGMLVGLISFDRRPLSLGDCLNSQFSYEMRCTVSHTSYDMIMNFFQNNSTTKYVFLVKFKINGGNPGPGMHSARG